jgi:asparagine synthase (glutamine-hydrolysing)
MSQPMSGRAPLAQSGDPPYISVLADLPVMRLCARITIDTLTAGGWTRAIARKAFVNIVPEKILVRRDKGNPIGFTDGVLLRHHDFVYELLVDGLLVKHGLLDRDKLLEALSDQPTSVSSSEVLEDLSTEIWLRRWAERQSQGAA